MANGESQEDFTPEAVALKGNESANGEAGPKTNGTASGESGDTNPDRPILQQSSCINDLKFMNDLNRLHELRSFFIQEGMGAQPDTPTLAFGHLNVLHYSEHGRSPTEAEWNQLESHTQTMFRLMTEPARRRFVLGGIPWSIALVPVVFMACAMISLLLAIIMFERAGGGSPDHSIILGLYVIYLMSLGAIGSVAFIGMNALSVQEDVTFDLTNHRLMILRIVLGALFGLVLTIPFGFGGFTDFVGNIVASRGQQPQGAGEFNVQALILLLPFVLGFSTSLVILVLNRLVEAVQGFFGKPAAASDRSAGITPTARDTRPAGLN